MRIKRHTSTTALIVILIAAFLSDFSGAQPLPTFAEFEQQAVETMGVQGVQRIEFSGHGWEACLGQPWKIQEGWARWELRDYKRVIDYANITSLQTALRKPGLDPERLGGCGAQPGGDAVSQLSQVNSNSSWPQQLQLWLTPQGFLQLAASHNAKVEKIPEGYKISFSVPNGDIEHPFNGFYSQKFLLQKIETRIDDSVLGDMLFEAEFSDYIDFSGLPYPSLIVQKQGGFPTLHLQIEEFVANGKSESESRPGNRRPFGGGPAAQAGDAVTKIGDGIYVINGFYQSVVVEFPNYSVVIDGLQSDARVQEIIRLTKETIPNKPIAYVISTHLHFDHAAGLRQFIAEGAIIVTHKMNVEFLRTALATPRTIDTRFAATSDLPIKIEGVGDKHTLTDGKQRIELYKLNGSSHADDMLVAYIPSIKTVVEADLLQPWINPVFAGSGEGPHPYLVHLFDELNRIGIDYEQFVPIHRPGSPPTMSKADLLNAIKKE